ncbi:hypothetical protein BJ742DRAFT_873920 [Cladochytrium replicatum]|nr:hypothetical protein BJ742DRAFT_873920 [Cladochytrium replicatum]
MSGMIRARKQIRCTTVTTRCIFQPHVFRSFRASFVDHYGPRELQYTKPIDIGMCYRREPRTRTVFAFVIGFCFCDWWCKLSDTAPSVIIGPMNSSCLYIACAAVLPPFAFPNVDPTVNFTGGLNLNAPTVTMSQRICGILLFDEPCDYIWILYARNRTSSQGFSFSSRTEARGGLPQEKWTRNQQRELDAPNLEKWNQIQAGYLPRRRNISLSEEQSAILVLTLVMLSPPRTFTSRTFTGATARWNTTFSKEKWMRFARDPGSIYIPQRGKVTDLLPPSHRLASALAPSK